MSKSIQVLTYEWEDNGITEPHYEMHMRNINKDNCLPDMYKYLDCDTIDARFVKIDGQKYAVWFDDEFLVKEGKPQIISMVLPPPYMEPVCGNVMFTRVNPENGATEGLSVWDINIIRAFMDEVNKVLDSQEGARMLFFWK